MVFSKCVMPFDVEGTGLSYMLDVCSVGLDTVVTEGATDTGGCHSEEVVDVGGGAIDGGAVASEADAGGLPDGLVAVVGGSGNGGAVVRDSDVEGFPEDDSAVVGCESEVACDVGRGLLEGDDLVAAGVTVISGPDAGAKSLEEGGVARVREVV